MSGAARTRRDLRTNFWVLMFGCTAAPIFWLGQLLLAYWISAEACYGSDHPTTMAIPGRLHAALVAFDIIAILAGLAGLIVSLIGWLATRSETPVDQIHAHHITEGRLRFMALWGVFSSLCFLVAVFFETIASVAVPICSR